MTKHHFEPVAFEEPKDRGLRPLFVGRIAGTLDSVVDIGSLLFGAIFVIGGISLTAYNLYSVVVVLVSRGAWLALSSITLVILALAFYFWVFSEWCG